MKHLNLIKIKTSEGERNVESRGDHNARDSGDRCRQLRSFRKELSLIRTRGADEHRDLTNHC